MPTLNEFIERGTAFFNGELIPKASVAREIEASTATLKASLDASLAAEANLRSELQARVAEVEGLKAHVAAATSEIEALKQASATVPQQASAQAATILASAGVPAVEAATTPSNVVKMNTFREVVGVNISAGMTKANAIRAAIKSHPDLYQAYRATGGQL